MLEGINYSLITWLQMTGRIGWQENKFDAPQAINMWVCWAVVNHPGNRSALKDEFPVQFPEPVLKNRASHPCLFISCVVHRQIFHILHTSWPQRFIDNNKRQFLFARHVGGNQSCHPLLSFLSPCTPFTLQGKQLVRQTFIENACFICIEDAVLSILI